MTVSGVRRVVVGVSASPGSLPALRYAESVARREDAPLIAVYAWVPPGGELADRRYPSAHLRRFWQAAAEGQLREALDAAWGCIPDGLLFRPLVLRGEPGPALVEVAGSARDLLVVGAGRRGWLARVRHGRVSRYCVAHAGCPVVTVPPPALTGTPRLSLHAWSFRHRKLTADRALPQLQG